MDDKKVAVVEKQGITVSPADMIRDAVAKGADLEKLQGLLNLQMQWEGNEAKKAYHRAMAAFKSDPPKIFKDRAVSFNQTKYNYASLANVVEKISTSLSQHGLSATWKTQTNGTIAVTCRITHVQGHFEETTLSADADKSGAKNNIQAMGSTVTYLERYTLLALTGLATEDQDDDAQGVVEYIDQAQQNQIADMLIEINAKLEPFLKYLGVESLDKLPKVKFQQAVEAIKSAKAKKEKKGAKK